MIADTNERAVVSSSGGVLRVVAEEHRVVTEHAEEWVFHTGERIMHPFCSVMELTDDGLIHRWWDYSNLSNLIDNAPQWWLDHIAQGYRDT